jgi:hypothetical protein
MDLLGGKKLNLIQQKLDRLDKQETIQFISNLKNKNNSVTNLVEPTNELTFNRLCYLEDWNNIEVITALRQLHKLDPNGFIHRKDWEWAMGILAMEKFGKLNENSVALGVGTGTEPIPFFLANKIAHMYATDLYGQSKGWEKAAPLGFYNNPESYSAFPFAKDALTVAIMDGKKLEYPSESFDLSFSFSSIEHFGGNNHLGALIAL